MFDKAALNRSQKIQRRRFADTPADPAKFDAKQWAKADLIDGLRNAAQELLPAAPTRQSVATIRDRVRQAVTKHGLHFTSEVFRLASEADRLPAYWRDNPVPYVEAEPEAKPVPAEEKVIRIVAFSRDETTDSDTVYDIIDVPADQVLTNKGGLSAKFTGPLRDLINAPWVSRISIERAKKSV